jgi:transcriptional regulator with PAS, ATPase and Fis domain
LFGHVKARSPGAVRTSSVVRRGVERTFSTRSAKRRRYRRARALQHREVIPVGSTDGIPSTRASSRRRIGPDDEIRVGNFRSDLYYRLNVIACTCRHSESAGTIFRCSPNTLQRIAGMRNEPVKRLSEPVLASLMEYSWPATFAN